MKIYNTLTRQKEDFVPVTEGKVKIYSCGPTVYNKIHIGNARPVCVFDTLRRYLTWQGYEVIFVQNFTDVDDKIIKKANEEGVDSTAVANRYIEEYKTDAHGLNVLDPDFAPQVTNTMDEIIHFVETLVEKGFAYPAGGDVYFRTHRFQEYGKLSHMPLDDLEAGARIEVNSVKENPMDFALWKGSKPGEPAWPSPWGEGRPGWHIECSAMAKQFLGETIDIHCGGQDLVFPHHENEIAQSECANGVPFAHYWMHNGYINIDNKKMSKSLNNFFTTREIAEKYGYEPIRYLMLQAHYRSQINFTAEIMEACVASLERLKNCRDNLAHAMGFAAAGEISPERRKAVDGCRTAFITAMEDDLNTADAITALFELVREVNSHIQGESPENKGYVEYAAGVFSELTGVLGILAKAEEQAIPAEILALAEARAAARAAKDWGKADALRDEIAAKGYVLEETRQGTKLRRA